MSSTRQKTDAFESFIEEETSSNDLNIDGSSIVPRQISFSQRRATFGEIILVILPYLILLVDIFIYFVLRGFK
jgi:hypothetical protein